MVTAIFRTGCPPRNGCLLALLRRFLQPSNIGQQGQMSSSGIERSLMSSCSRQCPKAGLAKHGGNDVEFPAESCQCLGEEYLESAKHIHNWHGAALVEPPQT